MDPKTFLTFGDFLLENSLDKLNESDYKIEYRGEYFPGYNKPKRAPAGDKHKYRVLAKEGDEIGIVSFGARGYEDFLQHKDPIRRENFRSRMQCDKTYSKLTAKYWVCHYNW